MLQLGRTAASHDANQAESVKKVIDVEFMQLQFFAKQNHERAAELNTISKR